LGHHSGHFKMISGKRLSRYISIDSFLPTLKLFVSSVPAGRFLEVLFAGIVQQKKVPIFLSMGIL
jgi:hypothetical protein